MMAGSVEDTPSLARELASYSRRIRELETSVAQVARRVVSLPALEIAASSSTAPGTIYTPLTAWAPAAMSTLAVFLFAAGRFVTPISTVVEVEWHRRPWGQEELDANPSLDPGFRPVYLEDVAELPCVELAQVNGASLGATVGGVYYAGGVTYTTADGGAGPDPVASAQFRATFPSQPEGAFMRMVLRGEFVEDPMEAPWINVNVLMAVASVDGRA